VCSSDLPKGEQSGDIGKMNLCQRGLGFHNGFSLQIPEHDRRGTIRSILGVTTVGSGDQLNCRTERLLTNPQSQLLLYLYGLLRRQRPGMLFVDGHTVAHPAYSPERRSMSSSMNRSRYSGALADTWGRIRQLGSRRSGDSAGRGSSRKTSR